MERRKIADMSFVGGVFSYREANADEDGTWCDWWFCEDLRYPMTRVMAAAGVPRDEVTISPITMDDMRRGCWDPDGAPRGHGRQLGRGVALVPDLPAVLRTDLPRARGQGARRSLREGVQRLDVRRVVRRLRRSAHPAADHPALGCPPRGRRGPPQRGARRARGLLHRDPAVPRAAVGPRRRRVLGSFLHGVCRDRDGRVDAHRIELEDAVHVGGRAAGSQLDADLHERGDVAHRLPDVRRLRAHPGLCRSRTRRARSAGSRTCSTGPTRCGPRTADGAGSRTR